MDLRYRIVKTVPGYLCYVATARGLRRVYLPTRTLSEARGEVRGEFSEAIEDPQLLPKFASQLERYFLGEPIEFDVRIDGSGTEFEKDVWQACRGIAYGETRTYKELAERVGRPGGARAVGMAMSHNPCPIVVPCHRVVRTDGTLGGFSSRRGVEEKRELLEMERCAPSC